MSILKGGSRKTQSPEDIIFRKPLLLKIEEFLLYRTPYVFDLEPYAVSISLSPD